MRADERQNGQNKNSMVYRGVSGGFWRCTQLQKYTSYVSVRGGVLRCRKKTAFKSSARAAVGPEEDIDVTISVRRLRKEWMTYKGSLEMSCLDAAR